MKKFFLLFLMLSFSSFATNTGLNVGTQLSVENGATVTISQFTSSATDGSIRVFANGLGNTHLGSGALIFPTTAGSANQLLQTDGAGTLAWATPAAIPGLYREVYFDSSQMVPRTTNGPASTTEEYATNDVMVHHLDFDRTIEEAAAWKFSLPDIWDLGTIKFKVVWDGTGSTGGVAWGLRCASRKDGQAIDQAYGTEITVTDTFDSAGLVHITAATSAVTVGGSPFIESEIWCQISRKVGDAADTFNADVKLLGVKMQYKESTTASTLW